MLFSVSLTFVCSCSNSEKDIEISELTNESVEPTITADQDTSIIPIEGDREKLKRLYGNIKTRASVNSYDTQSLNEELSQLNEIPIYLQVQGNTDDRQFLNVSGKGKELTIENFKGNSDDQKFYLKILPATSGIPYLIYSKKNGTPIRLGAYKNKPNVKILYASQDATGSLFGASWDIKRAQYSSNAYIIEN